MVRIAAPEATILRPSVLFGLDDAFLRSLSGLVHALPVIPLFGSGETRLQPVYVEDVARAIECVLRRFDLKAHIYELGGPQVYRYRDLLALIAAKLERKRWWLPVPFLVWESMAVIASLLPTPPITRDQIALMRRDNIVDAAVASFADLDLEPHALEAMLLACIAQDNP